MRNVEFKAELRDPDIARAVCRELGALRVATLEQRDTYFRIADGRLKKRETAGEPTEWIFYVRDDAAGPKLSSFKIYSESEARAHFGMAPLPVWLVVEKTRELWMLRNVRLHIDRVAELGDFIEFEALVTRRNDERSCREELARLRTRFAPVLGEAISAGYSDLLSAERESGAPSA